MRLSFFIPWITTGRGGTEHVGAMMANSMAARGHQVFVHTFDSAKGTPNWPLADGIRLECHPDTLSASNEKKLIDLVTSERPDLIVGLHMNRTLFHYVSIANRIGVPVLISEHADSRETARIRTMSKEERRVAFSAATRLHLLAETYANDLPPALAERVTVLPNTVRPARQLADPVGPETEPKTALYVGRLASRKNVGMLIEAFAQTNPEDQWRLVIAGYGTEEEKLRRMVKEMGLSDRISLVGNVEDIYALYEQAQILCQPSLAEAFGLTALEAMAHGLPVVGLRQARGLTDVVQDEETGLLVGSTKEEFSAALLRLMNNPELRQEMGASGLQKYSNDFAWDDYAEKIEQMFQKTVETARTEGRRPILDAPLSSVVESRLELGLQEAFDTRLTPKDLGPLHISFFVPWITKGRGGTENVGTTMANAMEARGHRVTVHTFDDNQGPLQWPLADRIVLRYHPEKLSISDEGRLVAELAAEQPDLIVGLHMNRAMFHYASIAERIGCPVLLSEHGDPEETQRIGVMRAKERLVAFACATRIHLLSEVFAETLPEVVRERVSILPNTVPPARAQADPVGSETSVKTLLFVGRLVARKNVSMLIEAFAICRPEEEWRLVIAGYGPEADELKTLTSRLGLDDRVELLGRVRDAYPLYENAQILCLPSTNEAFGLTALEAMAHGLPTVGLRRAKGLGNVISDDATGLLAGNSPELLAEALMRLMNDAQLRQTMGEAGLRRYEDVFGWSSYPERIEAMLRKTVTTARRDGRRPALDDPFRTELKDRLNMGLQEAFDTRLKKS